MNSQVEDVRQELWPKSHHTCKKLDKEVTSASYTPSECWPGNKPLLRSKRLANDRRSIESEGYAFSGPAPNDNGDKARDRSHLWTK